jgi:hypothetical protein
MVSHDQRNRAALYRFTGASPATNYRMAIELQDYANRIQEHWRAATMACTHRQGHGFPRINIHPR